MWQMTKFTTDITSWTVISTGLLQGFGLGFIFVPLTTLTFASLAPHLRNEGTALFSLIRNIGGSIGISVVITYLAQRTQINHAVFSEAINPFNFGLQMAIEAGSVDLNTSLGLAMANTVVTRQAALLAYLQDFRLMMFVSLSALPLVFLLGPSKQQPWPDPQPT
jgi:DHA2 family multidrug resistance protein